MFPLTNVYIWITVIWTSSIGEQKFSGTCSYSRSIPSYSQLSQGSNPILVHLQAPHHSQTWLTEEEKYSRNSWKYFKIQHLMRDSWKYFFLPAIQYTLLIHDWQGTNTSRKILVTKILKNHKVLVWRNKIEPNRWWVNGKCLKVLLFGSSNHFLWTAGA